MSTYIRSSAGGTFSYDPNGRYYMMFLPETHEEGVFGLYDVELNFMASVQDLAAENFVQGPPPPPQDNMPPVDNNVPPPDGEIQPPPDNNVPPPEDNVLPPDDNVPPPADEPPADLAPASTGDELPTDEVITPSPEEDAAPPDENVPPTDDTVPPPEGEVPPFDGSEPPPDDGLAPPPGEPGPVPFVEPARVIPTEVAGLSVQPEFFRFVYGTDVPNERYDEAGNPYFDDVNGNGVEDVGEFTSDFRPVLFNPEDWRSTDVARYYRLESGGAVIVQEVDFESPEPKTREGEALVPRDYLPRLNAFRFGRPNMAINLLTTFLPPEFFDGAHGFQEDTPLGIFQAVAMINLVMEQVFNVEAVLDIDGDGPFEPQPMLTDAHLFVLPIGDPFVLMLDGFEALSEAAEPQ